MTDNTMKGEIVLSSGNAIEYFKNDWSSIAIRVAMLTKGGMTAEAAKAWNSLIDGVVPKDAIKSYPKGGKEISYISHTIAQQYMNAAWGHLWDMEVLEGWENPDGSTSARVKVTIHIPIGKDELGNIVFHDRSVTEVGSFEAYWKTTWVPVPELDESGKPKLDEKGNIIYKKNDQKKEIKVEKLSVDAAGYAERTMSTGDRINSAASRALPRIMMRLFDWGLELYDPDRPQMTNKERWNTLLRSGLRKGMTEEQIVQLLKDNSITGESLKDDEKYDKAFTLIYMYERLEDIPDKLKE